MKIDNIEIIKARSDQQSVIAQLYELYTYEMTDLVDFDIKDNGYYGYEDLLLYWKDSSRYPYLIWVNQKLAGFVLLQQGLPSETDTPPDVWDVAEFFIMRKFRKKGIGQYVAQYIWQKFKGPWQVRVWGNNEPAHAFWRAAIEIFSGKTATPYKQVCDGEYELFVYRF